MNYKLIIEADCNDGDYITSINTIDDTFLSNIIVPIVPALREEGGAWYSSKYTPEKGWEPLYLSLYMKYVDEEIIETFEEYVPIETQSCEPCHTIESISIVPEKHWTTLF